MLIPQLIGSSEYFPLEVDTIPAIYDTTQKTLLLYPPQILYIDNAFTGYRKAIENHFDILELRDQMEINQVQKYVALENKLLRRDREIIKLTEKIERYEDMVDVYDGLIQDRDGIYDETESAFIDVIEKQNMQIKPFWTKLLNIAENLLYVGGGVLLGFLLK